MSDTLKMMKEGNNLFVTQCVPGLDLSFPAAHGGQVTYRHDAETGLHHLTATCAVGEDVERYEGSGATIELAVANLNGSLPDTFQVEIHIPI